MLWLLLFLGQYEHCNFCILGTLPGPGPVFHLSVVQVEIYKYTLIFSFLLLTIFCPFALPIALNSGYAYSSDVLGNLAKMFIVLYCTLPSRDHSQNNLVTSVILLHLRPGVIHRPPFSYLLTNFKLSI